jgi:hypothetical protein
LATNADLDADGLSNLDEYIAGCDPLNAGSRPEVGLVTDPGPLALFQISTVTQRTYSVEYRTNLLSGGWQLHTNVAGTGAALVLTNQGTTVNQGFYRFRVSLP